MKINPQKTSHRDIFSTMLSAIAPRPVAFVSTLNKKGVPNLAPFSFFNGFGSNPPILVFSPSRRGRDNTTKHTFENVKQSREAVVNVVSYSMVEQMNLTSSDYPDEVSEFEKAGFTPLQSEMVKPFRVKESPVQMECEVRDIIETNNAGGAGNLVICEIVLFYIADEVLDANGKIDQNKIDLVGRLGGAYYCRASGEALFTVQKPGSTLGIGIDRLPQRIRYSKVLTGNDLGQLGLQSDFPAKAEVYEMKQTPEVSRLLAGNDFGETMEAKLHQLAKRRLEKGEVRQAFAMLMILAD